MRRRNIQATATVTSTPFELLRAPARPAPYTCDVCRQDYTTHPCSERRREYLAEHGIHPPYVWPSSVSGMR